jgi:type II secretory pathway pseudopilin PulG
MKKLWPGDTLIEVLFAFAILSLVISVMFSGATSSYRSAINAQDRTAASFVAQYQAEGLLAYRRSLAWDAASGQQYSFLDGDGGVDTPSNKKVRDIDILTTFCMNIPTSGNAKWEIITVSSTCSANAKTLAPTLTNPRIEITNGILEDPSRLLVTIRVFWTAKNSSREESVVNTILLTKQE